MRSHIRTPTQEHTLYNHDLLTQSKLVWLEASVGALDHGYLQRRSKSCAIIVVDIMAKRQEDEE